MRKIPFLVFSILLVLAVLLPAARTPEPIEASSVYDANGSAYFSSDDTTLVTYCISRWRKTAMSPCARGDGGVVPSGHTARSHHGRQ